MIKEIISNKNNVAYKKKGLNNIKNISNIKKTLKHLKIENPNSINKLNILNVRSSFINNNTVSINSFTYDEKNKNISTEKIFSNKDFTPSKFNLDNKIKKLVSSNKMDYKKYWKINIKTEATKITKIITPVKSRLTKNNDKNKFYKLYITNNANSLYKNYSKKNTYLSKTSRNNDSSNKSKKKINNLIYSLNNKNLISLYKSRNTLKKKNINNNQNRQKSKNSQNSTINCKTSYNFKKICKEKISEINKVSKYYSSNTTKNKKTIKNISKGECSSILKFFNANKDNKLKLKSEPKKITINQTKKCTKIINFKDLIKSKQNKYKNMTFKTIKYYNLNIDKSYLNINKNKYPQKINSDNIKQDVKIKSKTKNNSLEKNNIKNNVKSCDLSHIKLKKNNKKIFKMLPLNNIKRDLEIKYHSVDGKNNCKKILLGESKEKKNNVTKSKKDKILNDINIHNFTKDESSCNDIIESDTETNKKIINEIKTNNFEVNKQKEYNMKYTIFNELIDEKESNNQESHISKIIIGQIDGYEDIIESDKINNLLNQNQNINEIDKIKDPLDEPSESERKIIDMINFEDDDIDNFYTNDFKLNKKKNKKVNKIIKNEKKNIYFSDTSNGLNSGKTNNRLNIIKFEKYNPIKFRKKNNEINIKINLNNFKYKKNPKNNNNSINNNDISKNKTTVNSTFNVENKNISNNELNQNKKNLVEKKIEEIDRKDDNCLIL